MLSVELRLALVVHDQTFPPKHGMQVQVPISPVLGRQFFHALDRSFIVFGQRPLLLYRPRQAKRLPDVSFAEPKLGQRKDHRSSLRHGLTKVLAADP